MSFWFERLAAPDPGSDWRGRSVGLSTASVRDSLRRAASTVEEDQ